MDALLVYENFLQPEGKYKIHLVTLRGQKVSSPHEHMFSKHQSCFLLVPAGFTRTRNTRNPTLEPAGITRMIWVLPA